MIDAVVAIVGRPNVGKSSFFNRLIGQRISIVEDEPGVTRDRIYGKMEWLTKHLRFIDTGGFQLAPGEFQKEINGQVELAIDEADIIVFLVDGKQGLTSSDQDIAQKLYQSDKPVVLVVNKIDDIQLKSNIYDFYALGLGEPIAASSAHGIGVGEVLDKIVASLPNKRNYKSYHDAISFAIIGQPNVGKSSLLNAILNEERTIVSNIEGTTRDAIDTEFKAYGKNYVAIDTAGIRKRGKVFESTEKYAVIRALGAIERSDVILFLIDGEKGIRNQDKHVAGYAHNEGKPVIIIYNKWDLIDKNEFTMNEIQQEIKKEFQFLSYAPILFVSAKYKARIDNIIPTIDTVYYNSQQRITTSIVNEVVMDALLMTPPPTHQGRRLKVYYVSQVSSGPPTFVFFVNDPQLCHFSYKRYLENRLRDAFDFEGTPITLLFRKRNLT